MLESPARRIRSFVLRQGRITPGQERALQELLPKYSPGPGRLDLAQLFGRNAPCTLEIGFGSGDVLVELARRHPEEDFLGIEVHKPGVGALLLKLEQEHLGNVRVLCEDAVESLSTRLPDGSLDVMLVYFPDPWPKKRHHKRRLLQPAFAALAARKLKSGGRLHLATDWKNYAEHMLAVLAAAPEWQNLNPGGGFAPRPAERPASRFERRGLKLGHPVFDLIFLRR
jgi:tRNA (guanine-N7-)-methyltransferase